MEIDNRIINFNLLLMEINKWELMGNSKINKQLENL